MSSEKFGNVSVIESEVDCSDSIKNPDRASKVIPKYTPEYQRLGKEPVVSSYDPTIFTKHKVKDFEVPAQSHANVGQNTTWFDQARDLTDKPKKSTYQGDAVEEGQYCLILNNKIHALSNDKLKIESIVESLLFDCGEKYNIEDIILIKRIPLKIGVIADD